MNRFGKIFSVFLVIFVLGCSVAFANPPIVVEENQIVNEENIEQAVENAANTVNNGAYMIIEQVSDKCLPVCAIFILWGAVLYFIMGIRNLYKKRQGLLMMWGAFTFVVIAKIVNFVFWFTLVR